MLRNKPKQQLIVIVVAAESPEEFYTIPESWQPKEKILRELVQNAAAKGQTPYPVKVGEIYLGLRANKEWYRVQLLEISFNSSHNVYFVDHGRKGIVTELKTCMNIVAKMKPNVFKCSLVDSSKMNQDREREQFFKYLVSDRLVLLPSLVFFVLLSAFFDYLSM